MKTIYKTLIAAFLITQTAQAQITLLAAYHEPTVGVNGYREYDSTSAGMPHNTGANQTWDFFSLVQSTFPASTSTYMLPSSTPTNMASSFSGATLAEKDNSPEYTYYKSSNNQFELLGTSDGTNVTSYSDPVSLMKWPMSYQVNISDTYSGTMTGNSTGSVAGTSTTNATGYGNLTMPSGVVLNDVLQLMTTITETQTVATPSPSTSNIKVKSTQFYHGSQRYPVLQMDYFYLSPTSTKPDLSSIKVNYLLAVGITDYNLTADFAIYPNPARDNFIVNLTNTSQDNCHLEFYNAMGQVVKNVELGNASEIRSDVRISDLATGIYSVKTTLGNRSAVRKLIVE